MSPGKHQRDDSLAVSPADFRSYYGRPVIKPPRWRNDIPSYLFTGGVSAGASLLAAGADVTGRPHLRRSARWTALAGIGLSSYFLVNDLGKPSRFLNMLRVAKPTSPMSMGTWILATFGPAIGAAAVSELSGVLPQKGLLGVVRRVLPTVGRVGGWSAAFVAPHLATYTAVLLADTAVPAWHESYRPLPFVFAGSALASSAGAALLTTPVHEAGPVRRTAVLGAALDLAAGHLVENRLGLASEAFSEPGPRRLLRAAKALTAVGAVGAVVGRRSRLLSGVSGAALLVGSACTRFGIFQGGVVSAKDPKYTVVPQRERLTQRHAPS
ncbi:MAG: NrfD/PsrC family molybdoenzyme membrane anchor subunit [Actinomycetes bacterium]